MIQKKIEKNYVFHEKVYETLEGVLNPEDCDNF